MALFEDKRKPVDIYKEGSATVMAQDKNSALASRAANAAAAVNPIAQTSRIAGEGISRLGNTVLGSVANAAPSSTFGKNFIEHRLKVADQGNEAIRESALPRFSLPKPMVGAEPTATPVMTRQPATVPDERPVKLGVPSRMVTVNLSDNDKAIKGSMGRIDQALASGVTPTAEQGQKIAELRRQAGFLRGGTDRVPVGPDGQPMRFQPPGQDGNLDVQFAPGTDQAAINRFMENPTRPTAQINRFNANREGLTQGQIASQNADRILGSGRGSSGPPQAFSPSGPSKTWAQARATDAKAIANAAERRDYYNAIENERNDRQLANQEDQTANQLGIAQMNDATDRRNADLTSGTQLGIAQMNDATQRRNADLTSGTQLGIAQMNDATQRENIAGQNLERGTNIEAKNLEIGQTKKLLDLQEKYLAETDPVQKKALENQLYALQGKSQQNYQLTTRKGVGPDGYTPTETPYLIDREGNAREIGGGKPESALPPADPAQRKVGQQYKTANGKTVVWDGKGFTYLTP